MTRQGSRLRERGEHGRCLLPLPPQRLVAESLASVGLSGVERLLPSELSGGMRKRVALARAIIRDDTRADAEQARPCLTCSAAAP